MNAYQALAARPAGNGFLPWKTIGGYDGWYEDGASVDVAYTSPKNAIRTANWIRKHGIKKASRGIVGDQTFGMDVAPHYREAIEFVRMLKQAARQARKSDRMVSFNTVTGGFPWNPEPTVWEGPE